ncbi:MAG: hypothetical protein M4579_002926 [Chaenotheca gracillima]|nr:MAG: hypothetical protein M4579_002926 [Chaenotheca gracillima]
MSSRTFLSSALAVMLLTATATQALPAKQAKTCSWVGLPDLAHISEANPDVNGGIDTYSFDVSREAGSGTKTVANDLLVNFFYDIGAHPTCSLAFNFEQTELVPDASGDTHISIFNTDYTDTDHFSDGFTWNTAPAKGSLVGSVQFPVNETFGEKVVGQVDCAANTFRVATKSLTKIGEVSFGERYNWGLRLYAC